MYFFSWWSNYSDLMLLEHYGYNMDAMNDVERYGNVLPENMNRVKQIEFSQFAFICPSAAFIAIIIFYPYLLVVFVVHLGYKLFKKVRVNSEKSTPATTKKQ